MRRVSIQMPPKEDFGEGEGEGEGEERIRAELSKNTETQEPFMGIKVRRRSSMYRQYHGDYLNVPSNQQIVKLLTKQGDKQVLFADSVMKINRDGQIRRRILVITDAALYTLDNRWCNLKRRISLSAINGLCLSELSDNFLVIIVPSEYDCLLASTRKSEIVTVLVDALKNITSTPLEVSFANRFEYRVDCDTSRIVQFEEAEGLEEFPSDVRFSAYWALCMRYLDKRWSEDKNFEEVKYVKEDDAVAKHCIALHQFQALLVQFMSLVLEKG